MRKAPAPAVVASPVTDYAVRVVEGEIVAGRLVRLACQRHLRDLQDGAARGLWFDEEAAQFAIDFFARVTMGFWPVMAWRSAVAKSSTFALSRPSPTPMLSTIFSMRGTSIADL